MHCFHCCLSHKYSLQKTRCISITSYRWVGAQSLLWLMQMFPKKPSSSLMFLSFSFSAPSRMYFISYVQADRISMDTHNGVHAQFSVLFSTIMQFSYNLWANVCILSILFSPMWETFEIFCHWILCGTRHDSCTIVNRSVLVIRGMTTFTYVICTVVHNMHSVWKPS